MKTQTARLLLNAQQLNALFAREVVEAHHLHQINPETATVSLMYAWQAQSGQPPQLTQVRVELTYQEE